MYTEDYKILRQIEENLGKWRFEEIEMLISNFIWKYKRPRVVETI